MNAEFRYFGTNEEKDSFVIFEIDREGEKNAFIWVYIGDDIEDEWRVKVSAVSGLYSYMNHEVSPFYVDEDGVEDLIDKAIETLEKYPTDILNKKLKAFDDRYSRANEEYVKEWDKTEHDMFEEVRKARSESGYWPWTPKTED